MVGEFHEYLFWGYPLHELNPFIFIVVATIFIAFWWALISIIIFMFKTLTKF